MICVRFHLIIFKLFKPKIVSVLKLTTGIIFLFILILELRKGTKSYKIIDTKQMSKFNFWSRFMLIENLSNAISSLRNAIEVYDVCKKNFAKEN